MNESKWCSIFVFILGCASGSTDLPPITTQGSVIANSIGMKLVAIPAGHFMMGCSPDDSQCKPDEQPVHPVRITKSFYLGQYPVTQGQYKELMGGNPSKFQLLEGCLHDCPVETISWDDAQEFLKKLSVREKRKYRLPTEAEWEYAARAGTTTKYYWGNNVNGDYLWYNENSVYKTHPVGNKKPNSFGLYDMLGNVFQWCYDGYDAKFYARSPEADPHGVDRPAYNQRTLRGGSWYYAADEARVSSRYPSPANHPDTFNGFRVVLEVP